MEILGIVLRLVLLFDGVRFFYHRATRRLPPLQVVSEITDFGHL